MENLQMDILKESRGAEYFTNLHALIGLSADRWQEVITKELLDNALDAVDQLNTKEISIICDDTTFAVCDNGGGIPEEALDNIYDFNLYVSSKRHVRTVSRGAQGNALKTIIALCFKQNLPLYFVTNGKKITYTPDAVKIGLGHLDGAFPKTVEATDQPNGVYIEAKISLLWTYLWPYWHVNADVHFSVNGQRYMHYTEARKFSGVHSIHWYDLQAFNALIKRTAINFPEKTTKQFIAIFSGTQRIMASFELPGKLLQDFYTDDPAIERLFDEMRIITARFRPQILEKHAMGKVTATKMGGDRFVGYRRTIGSYELRGAEIPYLIEAVLTKTDDEGDDEHPERNTVTTCINNSMNYADMPFCFKYRNAELAGQILNVSSLSDLLHQSGFMSGTGHNLFIHLVTPHLEFFDKAKSVINSDMFQDALLSTIDPLVAPIVKAVRKAQRECKANNKPEPTRPEDKPPSKKSLMFKYFMEGARLATGDWEYTTTARQVFYAIRKLVINDYGIALDGKTDFSILTQVVITEMFEQNPELEDLIYFERRGFYLDQESGEEIPMNTQRVNAFAGTLNQRSKCHVDLDAGSYTSSRQRIEYPYELAVSQVLFIEKQGFTEVFKRSGILDELNLGLISSQGFGTRAIKKMIQDFIGRGITVYALTDCDLAGQLIAERLAGGSNTFKEKLDINLIGLTYADAKELGKLQDAEEYESNKSYVHVLARMDQDEKDFFLKEKHRGWQGEKESFTYRRVELNALTMPEILDFIRSKIPKRQVRPTRGQIRQMVKVDADELKRDAVMQYLLSQVEDHMEMLSDVDVSIDADKMADQIDHALDNGRRGEKWQHVFRSIIERRQEKAMIRLQEALGSNV